MAVLPDQFDDAPDREASDPSVEDGEQDQEKKHDLENDLYKSETASAKQNEGEKKISPKVQSEADESDSVVLANEEAHQSVFVELADAIGSVDAVKSQDEVANHSARDGQSNTVHKPIRDSDLIGVDTPSVDRPIRQPRMRNHPTLASWSILLAVFALVTPALLIDIYHPDVVDPLESKALATSIHTWQRMNLPRSADESFIAEYLPHYNGQQQWDEPPGVTWTQLLTFEFAAPRVQKELKTTLTVGAKLTAEQMAPLPAFDATGKTMAQLSMVIKTHVEEKVRWSSVQVHTNVIGEQNSDGGALQSDEGNVPNDESHAVREGVDQSAPAGDRDKDTPLQAGDRVQLVIDYVPAHWRSQVNTMDLIRWGRQGSALMALILLGAVFWAGHSIGGNRTATFAMLICAANPTFLFYARLASPPIHQATWAMLSIAGALWAVRPLRPAPSVERQFIGWLISGLALGFAALTTGPIVLVTVAIPILMLLLLCPNRAGHLSGLVAALIIGILMITPWTALLHDNDPDAAVKWMREHQPFGKETLDLMLHHIGQRLGLILLVVAPWTFWLIGAAIQPFSTSSIGSRTRMFLGLTWFSAISLILLTQSDTDHLGAFLPLIPVGSIMIGQVFRQYTDLSEEGRFARYWRLIRWPHLLLLIVLSVLLPSLICWPQWFIENNWISDPLTQQWGLPASAGLCVVMLTIVGVSVRYSIQQYPQRALVAWSCWVLVSCAVIAIPASRNLSYKSDIRSDAQRIAKRIAETDDRPMGKDQGPYRYPVYAIHDANEQPLVLAPEVLLYAGIEIRSLSVSKLGDLVAKEKRSFFLVRRIGSSKRSDVTASSQAASVSSKAATISDDVSPARAGEKAPCSPELSPDVDAMSKAIRVEIFDSLQLELLKYEIQPSAVSGQP